MPVTVGESVCVHLSTWVLVSVHQSDTSLQTWLSTEDIKLCSWACNSVHSTYQALGSLPRNTHSHTCKKEKIGVLTEMCTEEDREWPIMGGTGSNGQGRLPGSGSICDNFGMRKCFSV